MSVSSSPEDAGYAQAVPAVQRALAALERLAGVPDGLTLSVLARDLQVSPSSLLAILNTLAAAGYLDRDPRSRRYRLAAGAHVLAQAPVTAPDLQREFGPIGDRLADDLGETAQLWVPDGSEVVIAAFREGRRELRWIPRPGLRRPAGESAVGQVLQAIEDPALGEIRSAGYAVDDSADEPRIRTLAAASLGSESHPVAVLALTGPADRLSGSREAGARTALIAAATELSRRLGCRAYRPYGPLGASRLAGPDQPGSPSLSDALTGHGGLSRTELDQFLSEPWVARLACVKENGYPYVVPVWYEWDGATFWIVARTETEWAHCVRHNPHVSMSIDEPDAPLRRVIVEGQAEVIEEAALGESQLALVTRIAERYLGPERSLYLKGTPVKPYALLGVRPVKLTTWRGLISHPRYERRENWSSA